MSRGFNYEGPIFSGLSRFADLLWLNIVFIICCIPIFTIGAATTALYYVTLKMAKDEDGYLTKSFFKSFIQNFKQGTGIWLIFVLIGGILVTDITLVGRGVVGGEAYKNVILVASGVIGILMIFTLTYVFPILAQFDNTIRNTIKNAFLISIRHFPYTVMFIVISIIPYLLMYFSTTAYMLVFIMFALVAYINSKFFNKIFVLYMPKEVEDNGDEHIFSDGEANG